MKRIFSVLLAFIFMAACTKKTLPTAAKTSATPVLNPGDWSASGKLLFESKCGRCHDLPKPPAYSYRRWSTIMDEMAPKARLSDQEKTMVLTYVQDNAMQ